MGEREQPPPGHPSSTYLPGAWAPAASTPDRAFLRKLSACSLLLSRKGALAGAGVWPTGPLVGAAGLWKNLSRAC